MWHKIYFNALNIEHETAKATLIKLPNKSKYAGYKFWHPSKLVREEGGKGYHKSFSCTEEFEFRIFKKGNGKYNTREIINEKVLYFKDILEMFEGSNSQIPSSGEEDSFLEVSEPEKITANIKLVEELKNKVN